MTRWLYYFAVLFLFVLICVMATGCHGASKKAADQAAIKRAQKELQLSVTNMALTMAATQNAKIELAKVIEALSAAPVPEPLPLVGPALNMGLVMARLQSVDSDLNLIASGIKNEDGRIQSQQKSVEDLRKQLDEARNEKDKTLMGRLEGLIILGILIATVGFVAGAIGSRIGISIAGPWAAVLGAGNDVAMGGVLLASIAFAFRAVGPYAWIGGLTAALVFSAVLVYYVIRAVKRHKLREFAAEATVAVKELYTSPANAETLTPVTNAVVAKAFADTADAPVVAPAP